jgi:hypothetical protein
MFSISRSFSAPNSVVLNHNKEVLSHINTYILYIQVHTYIHTYMYPIYYITLDEIFASLTKIRWDKQDSAEYNNGIVDREKTSFLLLLLLTERGYNSGCILIFDFRIAEQRLCACVCVCVYYTCVIDSYRKHLRLITSCTVPEIDNLRAYILLTCL